MTEKEWVINTYPANAVFGLSKKLNISKVLAKLLINRGYSSSDSALSFIKKDLSDFHSPFLMKDVEKAAKLLIDEIKKGTKILIWGDYDVDGVTSVTVLLKYILSIGGKCDYYIPKRDDDGYGLNDKVINEQIAAGIGLMITVDSGITAINEIKHAKDSGMRVIVTDHHECRDILPDADAIINPKRKDCVYPFKELAGVGVVFKFICAVESLNLKCPHHEAASRLLDRYSDFVAIGTIADVMPIIDENRLIVARGLSQIAKTENKGLSALVEEAGLIPAGPKKKKISSASVGFVLAPRINAAGRMETSKIAVELFLTESSEEAAKLAVRLSEINKQRQILENESLTAALEKIYTQCDIEHDKILVLEDDNWHHGIIGIVSSRITERYNLPSILISFKNEIIGSDPEIGKGSARSIKGMNLVESLSSCADILQKFGGHELAAGLSIKRSDLPEFRIRINEYAQNAFKDVNLTKTLNIDCELLPQEATIKLANEITKLEPFGSSNPVPVFAMNDIKISSVIPIGEGKHTKLILEKDGHSLVGLMFGTPTASFSFLVSDNVDIAFNIDINTFKNQQSVQMIIRDIRPSKPERDIISQHIYKYNEMVNSDSTSIHLRDIPTRIDFAKIYTTLKELISSQSSLEFFDLYIPYLVKLTSMKCGVNIPLFKALIIIDVLQETNLISVSELTSPLLRTVNCTESLTPKDKVILENTPTIRKLFSKAETN